MGGFKEGASTSPFDDSEDDGNEDGVGGEAGDGGVAATPDSDVSGGPEQRTDRCGYDGEDEPDVDTSSEPALPWIYRREGARSDRDITVQLHLQQETAQRETAFKADLERMLDEKVYLADLREAALLVAMDNPDAVVEQLREWGYDYE